MVAFGEGEGEEIRGDVVLLGAAALRYALVLRERMRGSR
jgi:hypothetical protein